MDFIILFYKLVIDDSNNAAIVGNNLNYCYNAYECEIQPFKSIKKHL